MGFVIPPGYTGIHISHGLKIALGKLRVSSHRLEIEHGRERHIHRDRRICRLCDMGAVETGILCAIVHYTMRSGGDIIVYSRRDLDRFLGSWISRIRLA